MNDIPKRPAPAYVPRAAEEVWTSPSAFHDVTVHGFVVKANATLLDDVLTRYIDRPSQDLGRRVAVETKFDHVLFLFVESQRSQREVRTAIGERGSPGTHTEKMFTIVVFGTETHPQHGPIAYAPYVYASSPPGWRTEREIFGYPQQLARIVIRPDADRLPASLKVRTVAIKKFSPDAMAARMTIVHLRKKSRSTERACSENELVRAIVDALTGSDRPRDERTSSAPSTHDMRRRGRRRYKGVRSSRGRFGVTAADVEFFKQWHCEATDSDPLDELDEETDSPLLRARRGDTDQPEVELERSLRTGIRMLFLKQFRDIVFADRACFQAVVEASIRAGGNGDGMSGWISNDYELTLEKVDSAPICRELGVGPGTSDVALAFGVKFNNISIANQYQPATVVSNPYWNPARQTASPDERPRLPRYVERGADAVWRQPSMLFGARIYGFGVKVDVEHQAKVLNRYVNDVAGGCNVHYGPEKFHLTPCQDVEMVMLMFVNYTRVASGTDDDSRLGGVSYREFLVTQLAFFRDEEFPELNWLIPFIYLDQDSPRLGGREIYGYPKQLGRILRFQQFAKDIEAARRLELLGTVLSNDRAARVQPIVKVSVDKDPRDSPDPRTPPRPPETLIQYRRASDMIGDLLGASAPSLQSASKPVRLLPESGLGLGVDLVRALLSGGVGHVFLKQFRDSADPERPCYQAICKTDTVPGRFRGGARVNPDRYRITIGNNASERLLHYLGKSPQEGANGIKPDFAYWMDLDVELTTGRVIANSFEREFVPDRSNPARNECGPGRRIQRTGERAL